MSYGVARLVGTIPNDHEIFSIMFPGDLELYHLDPPLRGYRIVAAAHMVYPAHMVLMGDPDPPPYHDPVTTYLYGTTGGEGLQIVWQDNLLKADGRVLAWALADAGYQVRR